MEDQEIIQERIELCIDCAEECATNAKLCQEEGMDTCARLCLACADACNKVVADGFVSHTLIRDCAEACRACAEECDKHDNDHCNHCAEVCRSCERACLNA